MNQPWGGTRLEPELFMLTVTTNSKRLVTPLERTGIKLLFKMKIKDGRKTFF